MITDTELETLEIWLDGGLPASESEALERRLSLDPELSKTVAQLRAEREARAAVWQSLQPGEQTAAPFARRAVIAARRQEMWRRAGVWARRSGAAAACIAVGLFSGYMGWGRGAAKPVVPSGGASNPTELAHSIHFNGNSTGPYQVVLTDDSGKVIAVQKFDRAEDARDFAGDLGQWENRRSDVQNGHAVLVSDEF